MRRNILAVGVLTTAVALLSVPITADLHPAAAATPRAAAWHSRVRSIGASWLSDISCPTRLVCTVVGGGDEGRAAIFRTSNGAATWHREFIAPDTASSGEVTCPTTSFCLVTVSEPYSTDLYATTDSGTSWKFVAGGGRDTFYASNLDCVSATACYAIAGIGSPSPSLIFSSDGGTEWNSATASLSNIDSVDDISCSNATTCLIIGSDSASNSIVIDKSTDSGSTIRTVETHPGDADFSAISCASAATCVATAAGSLGASTLWTSNGGTSWSPRLLPAGLIPAGKVSCESASTCVVTATYADFNQLVAATTSDSGSTWHVVAVAPNREAGSSSGGMACLIDARCLLDGFGTAASSIFIEDGTNQPWAKHHVPTGPPPLAAVACPTASTCVAVGTNVEMSSADGGVSWTTSKTPSAVDAVLSAVACPTATRCLAVGEVDPYAPDQEAVVYQSTNAGGIWHRVSIPAGDTSLSSVACASQRICIATPTNGAGNLLRTSNAGTTWETVSVPPGLNLEAVTCGSTASCVAVGWDAVVFSSVVLVTTNGGLSWSRDAASPGEYLNSVSCLSATRCVAAGGERPLAPGSELSGIFGTTDGGQSWSQLATTGDFNLTNAIRCSVHVCQEILTLGENYGPPISMLETSVDAGVDWSTTSLPSESILSDAVMAPTGRWVLVGGNVNNGALVVTSP